MAKIIHLHRFARRFRLLNCRLFRPFHSVPSALDSEFTVAAVAGAADKRGYGQGIWFLTSLVLCPISAVILLNAYPVKIATDEVRAIDNLSITSTQ
jgi:hypothetical protein